MNEHKHDTGKPLAGTIMEYFPRSLLALASVSTFGATKYGRGTWSRVERQRYADAHARHMLAHHTGEIIDKESGLPHLHLALWNLTAIVELDARNTNQ